MTTKADIEKLVDAKLGKNFLYRDAAIDSIWYSVRTSRPIEEAARGLANAISVGVFAPTEHEIAEARDIIKGVA